MIEQNELRVPHKWHPFRWHAAVLLAYFVFAVLYTWPAARHFTTHIPGEGDAPWFLWQFWWFKHAIFDLHQLPYTTDMIFYPLTDVPVLAQTPFSEILMVPLLLATNLIVYNNTLFFLSYILSGYFTYLLGRALGCKGLFAFVGGLIFAFCSYRGMRGLGHMSLLTTQWMPLMLLAAYQAWHRPTWQRGIGLGVATALVALSSPYYVGIFLFPVGLVGTLYLARFHWSCLWRGALWRMGMIAAAIASLFVVPAYLHYLFVERDIYAVNSALGADTVQNAADLLSWLLPPGQNQLWGHLTAPIYQRFSTPNLMETTVFVGYVPLIFLVGSFFLRSDRYSDRRSDHYSRRSSISFWQWLALFAIVLSLGPHLHLAGKTVLQGLPYQWLLAIPGFDSFRIPSRAGITAALAISVVVMVTLQQLAEHHRAWLGRWQWVLGIVIVLYLVNVSPIFPYPLTNASIPQLYSQIEGEPTQENGERTALLELPAGEYFTHNYNFFKAVSQWMYYQSSHQRPVISGYLGRRPARLHEPEHALPFVRRLFADGPFATPVEPPLLDLLPAPYWPRDIHQAPSLLEQAGISDVLLHCALPIPENQYYCLDAAPLLGQALGFTDLLEPTATDAHRLHQVHLTQYTSQLLPQYFTELTPHFDSIFVPNGKSSFYRGYALQDNIGTIDFYVPYAGVWRVQGILTGTNAGESEITLDDQPLVLTHDRYLDDGHRWHVETALDAGHHTLRIQKTTVATETTAEACTDLCVQNVSIRLQQPKWAPSGTAQAMSAPIDFVNQAGRRVALLDTQLFISPESQSDSPAMAPWLLTIWQIDEALETALLRDNLSMPNLFVHILDEQGIRVAQADHPLGERYLYDEQQAILYDFMPLARALAETAGDEVIESATITSLLQSQTMQLGLWYPDRGDYFWQVDSPLTEQTTSTAEPQMVDVGLLSAMRRPFYFPTFPTTPKLRADFVGPTARFSLLDVTLQAPDENKTAPKASAAPWYLALTWQVPDIFRPDPDLVAFLFFSDLAGEVHAPIGYVFGGHDLLADRGGYVIDHVPLPPFDGDWQRVWFGIEVWNLSTHEQYTLELPTTAPRRIPEIPPQPNRHILGQGGSDLRN